MTDLRGVGFLVRGEPLLHRDLIVHALAAGGATSVSDTPPASPATTIAVLIRPLPDDWTVAQDVGARVVVVADCGEAATVVSAVARGAHAVVHHDTSPTDLRQVVGVVAGGHMMIDPVAAPALTEAVRARRDDPGAPPSALTRRERDILASIARGDSVKQTSRALGVAPKTVENLQGRLFRKLRVRNRAQAVARAQAGGLLIGAPSTSDEHSIGTETGSTNERLG